MKKSTVTNYNQYSAFTGTPAECQHHLIFGHGLHKLADEDGLIIGLTNAEHNMSSKGTVNQLHDNPPAEHLSKMLGQAIWERNYLIEKFELPFDDLATECRDAFMSRYGKSFL